MAKCADIWLPKILLGSLVLIIILKFLNLHLLCVCNVYAYIFIFQLLYCEPETIMILLTPSSGRYMFLSFIFNLDYCIPTWAQVPEIKDEVFLD